jgi:hypothetical protein
MRCVRTLVHPLTIRTWSFTDRMEPTPGESMDVNN